MKEIEPPEIKWLYNQLKKRKNCEVYTTKHTVVITAKKIPIACVRWHDVNKEWISNEIPIWSNNLTKVVKRCEEYWYDTMNTWQMGKD